jgi:hypothetical protein
MMGKHFNICKSTSTDIIRQYTIANCMQQDAYNEYLRVISEGIEKGVVASSVDSKFLEERSSDEISFSIKNYETKTGLSCKIFKHEAE